LVVLDSWALLAYLKDEPAAGRIEQEWISQGAAISLVNLGEALYIRIRESGEAAAKTDIEAIRRRSKIVNPDWPLVFSAARIKARGGLAYADAFCLATAERLQAPLWTGDPEIIAVSENVSCEVVDLRLGN
jgi:PIN domain nuclease of toxin-antitoxin system